MQLTFDADVEEFRAEFVAFLGEHLPSEAEAVERSRSSSDVPGWARRWQQWYRQIHASTDAAHDAPSA